MEKIWDERVVEGFTQYSQGITVIQDIGKVSFTRIYSLLVLCKKDLPDFI